ncbi:uncharacterized protein METZ01_LOCUS353239, partial [marine metagenome]
KKEEMNMGILVECPECKIGTA